jgi:hypothetical protein
MIDAHLFGRKGMLKVPPKPVNYAVVSGRQTGTMRIIKVYLDEIEKFPEMTEFYLGKIRQSVNKSLAESRPDNDSET